MAGSSSTFQSLQNWHDTDMYFIHVHNIGQIIGSMADLKTFFKIIHKLSLSRNIHAGDIMGSWDFVNQGKMYILHNLSLYRKIHAADLPMGYSIWNAILSRSTRLQAKEGAGPWSSHNVMKWCVCVLTSVWCVRWKFVSVRTGASRAGSEGGERETLHWKWW